MEIYRLYNGSTNKRTMSTNICRRYDIYIYITSIHSFTIYHTYRASHTHISHILWLALLIIQHAIQLPLQTTHNSCLKVRNTRSFPFDEVVQILHRPWNTRRKSKFLYRKKLRETMGTQGAKMDEIRWQPVVQGWEVTLLPIYRNAEMIEVFAEEKRTPTFLTWGDFVICSSSKTTWWLNNLSETKTQVKSGLSSPKFRGKHPQKKMIHFFQGKVLKIEPLDFSKISIQTSKNSHQFSKQKTGHRMKVFLGNVRETWEMTVS